MSEKTAEETVKLAKDMEKCILGKPPLAALAIVCFLQDRLKKVEKILIDVIDKGT